MISEIETILEKDVFGHEQDFERLSEAKLLDNEPALRNLITGLDTPSREALGKTIARVQAFTLACTRPNVNEYWWLPYTSLPGSSSVPSIVPVQAPLFYTFCAGIITAFASRLSEETLSRTAAAVVRANRVNFDILGSMAGSAALAGLDFSKFSTDRIQTFQTSYSVKLASTLRDILNEQESTQESINALQSLIDIKVSSLEPNRVSAEGMFNLLITVLAVVLASETRRRHFSREGFFEHYGQLDYILRGVLENTRRLIPSSDENTYYRVLRPVGISARPNSRAYQLGILVPTQTVRLVKRNHKWISVEYLDQFHGIARQGWAPKKYFQQLSAVGAVQQKEGLLDFNRILEANERKEITDDWEQTNKRRIDLIYKQAENELTAEEHLELDRLQRLTDARIRLVAPLPISSVEAVLKNLERRT